MATMKDEQAKQAVAKIHARIAEAEEKRERAKERGMDPLLRLCKVAQGDSGQCHHVRRFLLGLYNGYRWPFDLIRLRNLDSNLLDDCLAVLELDARGGHEVHTYIKGGEDLWRSWWAMEDNDE
ncbi:MAG: hypothetical protein KA296_13785 [Marinobacter sp.]|nr:hypothetical protein [Marinobacter sp.]